MTNNSHSQQSATFIAATVPHGAAVNAQESHQEIMEERRWQMEWERRNVED